MSRSRSTGSPARALHAPLRSTIALRSFYEYHHRHAAPQLHSTRSPWLRNSGGSAIPLATFLSLIVDVRSGGSSYLRAYTDWKLMWGSSSLSREMEIRDIGFDLKLPEYSS